MEDPEEEKRKKVERDKRKAKAVHSGVQFTHGYQRSYSSVANQDLFQLQMSMRKGGDRKVPQEEKTPNAIDRFATPSQIDRKAMSPLNEGATPEKFVLQLQNYNSKLINPNRKLKIVTPSAMSQPMTQLCESNKFEKINIKEQVMLRLKKRKILTPDRDGTATNPPQSNPFFSPIEQSRSRPSAALHSSQFLAYGKEPGTGENSST